MATYYYDPINGNDANDASSWALAKKTLSFNSIITGEDDEVLIAKTPDAKSLGNVTWTHTDKLKALQIESQYPMRSFAINSASGNGTTLTFTTFQPNEFEVGEMIASSNTLFKGQYIISEIVSTTSFRVLSTVVGTQNGGMVSLLEGWYWKFPTTRTEYLSVPQITENLWTVSNTSTISAQTANPYPTNLGHNMLRISKTSRVADTKYGHYTLDELDLSAFQGITFKGNTTISTASYVAGDFKICLCSDTDGDVIVDEFDIPKLRYTSTNLIDFKIMKNGGGNLGSSIKSIALYSGSASSSYSWGFWFENFVFITTDSISHMSMITKGQSPTSTEPLFHVGFIHNDYIIYYAHDFGLNQTYTGSFPFSIDDEASTIPTYFFDYGIMDYASSISQLFMGPSTVFPSTVKLTIKGGVNKLTDEQDGITLLSLDGSKYNSAVFFYVAKGSSTDRLSFTKMSRAVITSESTGSFDSGSINIRQLSVMSQGINPSVSYTRSYFSNRYVININNIVNIFSSNTGTISLPTSQSFGSNNNGYGIDLTVKKIIGCQPQVFYASSGNTVPYQNRECNIFVEEIHHCPRLLANTTSGAMDFNIRVGKMNNVFRLLDITGVMANTYIKIDELNYCLYLFYSIQNSKDTFLDIGKSSYIKYYTNAPSVGNNDIKIFFRDHDNTTFPIVIAQTSQLTNMSVWNAPQHSLTLNNYGRLALKPTVSFFSIEGDPLDNYFLYADKSIVESDVTVKRGDEDFSWKVNLSATPYTGDKEFDLAKIAVKGGQLTKIKLWYKYDNEYPDQDIRRPLHSLRLRDNAIIGTDSAVNFVRMPMIDATKNGEWQPVEITFTPLRDGIVEPFLVFNISIITGYTIYPFWVSGLEVS